MEYEKSYWNSRYQTGGTSGYGSYGEQLVKKLNWLKDLDVASIVEIGCGDFNFGSHLTKLFTTSYVGYDISDVIIARNQSLYPQHTFKVMEDDIPTADLLLCVDVLFHVLDPFDCEQLLAKLVESWTKYLAITAYERDEEFINHVRIRKFDYKRFGEPLIREIVESDGNLYFYLFKR